MEQLSKDLIIKIALSLNIKDIFSFCGTSRRFNKIICENKTFWGNKLIHDFGIRLRDISKFEKDPKRFYEMLIKNPEEIYQRVLNSSSPDFLLGLAAEYLFRQNDRYKTLKKGEIAYILYRVVYNMTPNFVYGNNLDMFEKRVSDKIETDIFLDTMDGVLEDTKESFESFYGFSADDMGKVIEEKISKIRKQNTVVIKIPTYTETGKIYNIYVLHKFVKN